jgi:hypothetical protein
MKKSSRIGASLGLLISVLLLLTPHLQAAKTPTGLQVSPLRTYPTQDPGSSTNGSLTLTNYTNTAQQILLSTETFQVTGEDYRYSFGSNAATKWIVFSEPTMNLAPRETKVANYTIAVPANASPGGKYLALITSISPIASEQKITEIHRVASLVYLQVNGQITKSSHLLSFDTPRVISKPSFTGSVRINNSGNTHFQSRVGFYVNHWPLTGKGSYVTQVQGYVLPGTVRQLSTIINTPRTPGVYKITAEYASPQGGVTRVSQLTYYIPMWFVISVVVFLCCLIVLIIRFWRSRPAPLRKRRVKN